VHILSPSQVGSGNGIGFGSIAQEQVKALETKIELVNLKLQVAVADSERWKRKYNGMLDRSYGSVESSRNSSWNSVKILATPAKRSAATRQLPAPKKANGESLLPLS
jgi:hypothetical protein